MAESTIDPTPDIDKPQPRRRGPGRPRKYNVGAHPLVVSRMVDFDQVIDISDLLLDGEMTLEDMIDNCKAAREVIPSSNPGRKTVMRIDRIMQVNNLSPLYQKSVFRPDLSREEMESLNPGERLRVALFSGDPVRYSTTSIDSRTGKEKIHTSVKKHRGEANLYATRFRLRTAEGRIHRALLFWQTPSSLISDTRMKTPGWNRVDTKVKTRQLAMEGGELNNVLLKLSPHTSDALVPRYYPVLITRPLNMKTRESSLSSLPGRRAEEDMMLSLLSRVRPQPSLNLGDRLYNLELESLFREEETRFADEDNRVRQARLDEIQRTQDLAQEIFKKFVEQGFSDLEARRQSDMYAQAQYREPAPARPIRPNLYQKPILPEDADLLSSQGAVALFVSDPEEILKDLPSTSPADALGVEGTWRGRKGYNKAIKVTETGEHVAGRKRSLPNIPRTNESGAYLKVRTDTVLIHLNLRLNERTEYMEEWPSFLPPEDDLSAMDTLRVSEVTPPLAVRFLDPFRRFYDVTDEEFAGRSCDEETLNTIALHTREAKRIAVLLAPGQTVAETKRMWLEDSKASRVIRLRNRAHLLIFGSGEELSWPLSSTQTMQQVLSVLTGREIITFDSQKYRGPIVPYNESLQLENTEEPEYLIEP